MGTVTVSPKFQIVIPKEIPARAHSRTEGAGDRLRGPHRACPGPTHQADAGIPAGPRTQTSRAWPVSITAQPDPDDTPGRLHESSMWQGKILKEVLT